MNVKTVGIVFCSLLFISTPLSAALPLYDSAESDILADILSMIDEDRITADLQYLDDFGPRPTGSDTLGFIQEEVIQRFSSFDLAVSIHHFTGKDHRQDIYSDENIIATQHGLNPGNGVIILCAHLDSVIQGPGIDDDGSGVAAVLEAARVLSNYTFNTTIRYILFSGEEQGLLGSGAYAEECKNQGENILHVICLDAVGYAVTAEQGSILKHHSDPDSAWLGCLSSELAMDYPEYIPLTIEQQPHLAVSDHESFHAKGYSVSYYYEHTLTPYYHTPEDSIEHINTTYLSINTRLITATIALFSSRDTTLTTDDITIAYKGSILSAPDQFTITLTNSNDQEPADLYIDIEFTDLIFGETLPGVHDTTCHWMFGKEIQDSYQFVSGTRYYFPRPIRLTTTVYGIGNDMGVFKTRSTLGISLGYFIILLPKN